MKTPQILINQLKKYYKIKNKTYFLNLFKKIFKL